MHCMCMCFSSGSRPYDAFVSQRESLSPEACGAALEACACLSVRRASRAVTRLFDEVLQPSGLRSTQFVILAAIHRDAPCTVAALARTLDTAQSTLSRNVKPLSDKGLIRSTAGGGPRGTTLELSAKGLRLVAETVPLWQEAQGRFLEELGSARWGTTQKSLDRVARAARNA